MRRIRARASSRRITPLLRHLNHHVFPASVAVRRHGRLVARLVEEADYQEVIGLMAEHLRHLADEAEGRAVPLEEILTRLEERSAKKEG